jgi:hypothetical protein
VEHFGSIKIQKDIDTIRFRITSSSFFFIIIIIFFSSSVHFSSNVCGFTLRFTCSSAGRNVLSIQLSVCGSNSR